MFKTSKVSLRTAQRHLGARDLLAAETILWEAEVRMFRDYEGYVTVDSRELEEFLAGRTA